LSEIKYQKHFAPLAWALVCAAFALSWQALTVHFNYRGNWTGPFVTGEYFAVPPALAFEHVWQDPKSYGWDGQFYHFIAHDPLPGDSMARYVEAPRLRYRRILIPAAAFLLAFGQPAAIDWSYRIVILFFFALGTYWTARLVQESGRNPAWGLLFFFLPAAMASIDRMAVDVGLSALTAGFVLYSRVDGDRVKLFLVLIFAGLVRDTGLLLTAAYCLWLLTGSEPVFKRIRRAALFATAAIPTLAWYLYVNLHTGPYQGGPALSIPLSGLLDRFIHPVPSTQPPAIVVLLHISDLIAVTGVLLAFVLALRHLAGRLRRPSGYAILLFVGLAVFFWRPGDWMEALDYGRILSPMMFLLALEVLDGGSWILLAPVGMEAPRFAEQVLSQVAGVAKGVLG
jgi:hypothetical protein